MVRESRCLGADSGMSSIVFSRTASETVPWADSVGWGSDVPRSDCASSPTGVASISISDKLLSRICLAGVFLELSAFRSKFFNGLGCTEEASLVDLLFLNG